MTSSKIKRKNNSFVIIKLTLLSILVVIGLINVSSSAYAQTTNPPSPTQAKYEPEDSKYVPNGGTCGAENGQGNKAVHTSINIGCKGVGNPIIDALFAIIRFLSAGVGLAVIASIIVAGIMYTGSRGDPGATAKAITRIRSSLIALVIFIFAYAFLNYIVPGQFLR